MNEITYTHLKRNIDETMRIGNVVISTPQRHQPQQVPPLFYLTKANKTKINRLLRFFFFSFFFL